MPGTNMLPKTLTLALTLTFFASALTLVPSATAATTCSITSPAGGSVFHVDDPDFTFAASTDGSAVQFGVNNFPNDFTDFSSPFQYQKSPGASNLGQGSHSLKAICDPGNNPVNAISVGIDIVDDAPVPEIIDHEIRDLTTVSLQRDFDEQTRWRVYADGAFQVDVSQNTKTIVLSNATADAQTCYTITAYAGTTQWSDTESAASAPVCLTPSTHGGGPTDFVDNPSGGTLFDAETGGGVINSNRYQATVDPAVIGSGYWLGKQLSGTATTTSVEFDVQWPNPDSAAVEVVLSKQALGVNDGVRDGAARDSVGVILHPLASDEVQVDFFENTNGVRTLLGNALTGDNAGTRHKYTLHADLDNGSIQARDENGDLIGTATIPTGGAVYSQWYMFKPIGGGSETVYLWRDQGSTTVDDAIITSTADPPGPVENLTTTPLAQAINVTWDPPLDDGGEAIVQYTIYFDDGVAGTVTPPDTGAVLMDIFDQDLHWVNVTASNGAGEGPIASVQGSAGPPPPAPSNFCDNNNGATAFNEVSSFSPIVDGPVYRFDTDENLIGYLGADLSGSSNEYEATFTIESLGGQPAFTAFLSTNDTLPGDSVGGAIQSLSDSWTSGVYAVIEELSGGTWSFGLGEINSSAATRLQTFPTVSFNSGTDTSFVLYYNGTTGALELQTAAGVELVSTTTNETGNIFGGWFADADPQSTLNADGQSVQLSRSNLCFLTGGSPGTAIQPPGAPQNLVAEPDDQRVTLSWDVPASNGGEPVIQYRGWENGNIAFEVDANTLTQQVLGLVNDVESTFNVQARNSQGYGANATVTATPFSSAGEPGDVPGVPQNVLLASLNSNGPRATLRISWLPPGDGVLLDQANPYVTFVTRQSDGAFAGSVESSDLVTTMVLPTSNDGYCVKVAAQGIGGFTARGNFSEPVCINIHQGQHDDNEPPFLTISNPQGDDVFAEGEVVTITSSANDVDGQIHDVSYVINGDRIREVDSVQSTFPYPYQASMVRSQTVIEATARDNLGYGTTVLLIVDVVDEAAGSPPSSVLNLTQARINTGYNVTWSAPKSDGGSPITAYRFHREIAGVFRIQAVLDPNDVALQDGSGFFYHDLEAVGSDNFCWRVTAENEHGVSPGAATCVEGERTGFDPEDPDGDGLPGTDPFDTSRAAESTGIAEDALKWLLAIILTGGLSLTLAFFGGSVGERVAVIAGLAGALMGIGISFALGFIPPYFIFLLILLGAAGTFGGFMLRSGSSNA